MTWARNECEVPRYNKVEFPQWYYINYRPRKDDKGWTQKQRDQGINYYACRKKECNYFVVLKMMDLATHMLTYHGEELSAQFTESAASRYHSISVPRDERTSPTFKYMRSFPSLAFIAMSRWPNTAVISKEVTFSNAFAKPDPSCQSKDADKYRISRPRVQGLFCERKSAEQILLEAEVKRLAENLQSEKAKRLKLDADLKLLGQNLESERGKLLCNICMERIRDTLILPCTHFHYCNRCLLDHKERSNTCPTCRGSISALLHCQLSIS